MASCSWTVTEIPFAMPLSGRTLARRKSAGNGQRRIGARAIGTITGLPLATGFLAPSLSWVKRNEPHMYQQAAHAVLPKDYIRYRLTGEIATDVTDASGSLLFDVAQRQWSEDLLRKFDLDDRLLPAVLSTRASPET